MVIPQKTTPITPQPLLDETASYATEFLDGLAERRVAPTATAEELRKQLGGPLPDKPHESRQVIADLIKGAEPGIMATPSGRFFGFVIGGSLSAALAADWLASTWDQNAGLYAAAPAASVIEEVCGAWLKELLGLPEDISFGFVTGCQMAHFTALAAARHHVLKMAGWDVEANGRSEER